MYHGINSVERKKRTRYLIFPLKSTNLIQANPPRTQRIKYKMGKNSIYIVSQSSMNI